MVLKKVAVIFGSCLAQLRGPAVGGCNMPQEPRARL
jgi:hypothetical protein